MVFGEAFVCPGDGCWKSYNGDDPEVDIIEGEEFHCDGCGRTFTFVLDSENGELALEEN